MVTKEETERLISFMDLLHKFQQVERVYYAPDLIRKENDVEHSYLLAMACWYLVDFLKLDLSISKIMQYALVHDMVEIYAGDSYVFDTEAQLTKHDREKKAQEQLAHEIPEFPSMHKTIADYELQTDPESIFVRAVDKILPVITNYLQGGIIWKELGISLAQITELKRRTTEKSPPIHEIVEHLIEKLQHDPIKFFGNKTEN
ncbi:MAG: metal dependent phosphohydrolase, putative hydrolase of superfamily [Candidatus Kaiserbacteria bacterium]|nr:metal dependent phosphohydrolase, putative hydrolase of superfamily [Candidatus Kaiserbacteria bacterium]